MSEEIVYRRYKPGDESGIVEVMNACFDTFRGYGLNTEVWLDYDRRDPGFKKEEALVAEHKGRIVGHVQLVFREIKLGRKTFITTGGIANVSTHPDYRGKGIATKLMKMALDRCKELKIPLSSLFTGYGYVAHRIYRRLGYADTLFMTRYLAEDEEVERTLEMLPEDPSVRVREYREGDEEGMLKVYEQHIEEYTGAIRRDLTYWKNKLIDIVCYHGFFAENLGEAARVLIAEKNGKVTGYAYFFIWSKARKPIIFSKEMGILTELVASDIKTLASLAKEALKRMREEKVKTFASLVPPYPPYSDLFREFQLFRETGIYMDAVVDQSLLFDMLCKEFSARLEEAGIRSEFRFLVESPYGRTLLEVKEHEVRVSEGKADVELRFVDMHSFVRMLYGIEGFADLLLKGKIDVRRSDVKFQTLLNTMNVLFPRMKWFIWPADHW